MTMAERIKWLEAELGCSYDDMGMQETDIYERTHMQTGEKRRGDWDNIGDLDKRVWSQPEFVGYEVYYYYSGRPEKLVYDEFVEAGEQRVHVFSRTAGAGSPSVLCTVNIRTLEIKPLDFQKAGIKYPHRYIKWIREQWRMESQDWRIGMKPANVR